MPIIVPLRLKYSNTQLKPCSNIYYTHQFSILILAHPTLQLDRHYKIFQTRQILDNKLYLHHFATGIQKDLLDIKVLSSPRLDILLEAGGGDGRVTQYDCDEGDKTLETLASTAAASIKVGRMGDTMADAATNAFAEETNVYDGIIISSPGLISIKIAAISNAAVQE